MHNQAYISGFVKRALEYGFSESEAMQILKQASEANDTVLQEKQKSYTAKPGPERYSPLPKPDGVPEVSLASLDSRNKKPVTLPIKKRM